MFANLSSTRHLHSRKFYFVRSRERDRSKKKFHGEETIDDDRVTKLITNIMQRIYVTFLFTIFITKKRIRFALAEKQRDIIRYEKKKHTVVEISISRLDARGEVMQREIASFEYRGHGAGRLDLKGGLGVYTPRGEKGTYIYIYIYKTGERNRRAGCRLFSSVAVSNRCKYSRGK